MATLKAHYEFDEGSGFVVDDESSNDNDLLLRGKTVLLLHCEGSDGSTSFVDSSSFAHTVTANGNAQHDTAKAKFGSSSALFDGTGDYLSVPDHAALFLNMQNFKIDAWIYLNGSPTADSMIVGQWSNTGSDNEWIFYVTGDDKLAFYFRDYWNSSSLGLVSTSTVSTDQWVHVAVSRYGNDFYLFIGGTKDATTYTYAYSIPPHDSSLNLTVGAKADGASPFNGWIDEVRIQFGEYWSATFTPETSAYTEDAPAWVTGYSGYGLLFDGAAHASYASDRGYSESSHSCDLRLNGSSYYCRFKTTSSTPAGILASGGVSADGHGFSAGLYLGNDGKLYLGQLFTSGSSRAPVAIATNSAVNDGNWHVAFGTISAHYDTTYAEFRLWLDGTEQSSSGYDQTSYSLDTGFGSADSVLVGLARLNNSGTIIYFPATSSAVQGSASFDGTIDTCRFWCGILEIYSTLAVADALHGQSAEAVVLAIATLLVVEDAVHLASADGSLELLQAAVLAAADALHTATADGSLSLEQAATLGVFDALHGASADGPLTLVGAAILEVADAIHAGLADGSLVLTTGGTPPIVPFPSVMFSCNT